LQVVFNESEVRQIVIISSFFDFLRLSFQVIDNVVAQQVEGTAGQAPRERLPEVRVQHRHVHLVFELSVNLDELHVHLV